MIPVCFVRVAGVGAAFAGTSRQRLSALSDCHVTAPPRGTSLVKVLQHHHASKNALGAVAQELRGRRCLASDALHLKPPVAASAKGWGLRTVVHSLNLKMLDAKVVRYAQVRYTLRQLAPPCLTDGDHASAAGVLPRPVTLGVRRRVRRGRRRRARWRQRRHRKVSASRCVRLAIPVGEDRLGADCSREGGESTEG